MVLRLEQTRIKLVAARATGLAVVSDTQLDHADLVSEFEMFRTADAALQIPTRTGLAD